MPLSHQLQRRDCPRRHVPPGEMVVHVLPLTCPAAATGGIHYPAIGTGGSSFPPVSMAVPT